MRIAFCLFKYFPYGGLQRDFLRIARVCHSRGHEIHVYTTSWAGERPSAFQLHRIEARGLQNHVRLNSFAKGLATQLAGAKHEVVVGFNKAPGLDIYYAADLCYQSRAREKRPFFYRLLPRYRQLLALEKSVFAQGQKTEILLIAAGQQKAFTHYYHTEPARFHLLPPGIDKDRASPAQASEIRALVRQTYKLAEDELVLLMVGSSFKTKGLDRALKGLACLPKELKARTTLWVVGQDDARPFHKLARQLKVDKHVSFLGGREDVLQFLLAADLLVHPAYHENTGTVLLEAMIAGLPVLTLETCGYAHYIDEACAGWVLPSPYQQAEFNMSLQKMLLSPQRVKWRQNALEFAREADIYSLPEKAANVIEWVGRNRVPTS